MYLGLVLIVLAILFVIVGIVSGGAFTIILVPLAVIAAVSAAVTLMSARAAGIEGTLTKQPERMPRGRLRHGSRSPPGEVPATPDEYVDARQRNQ